MFLQRALKSFTTLFKTKFFISLYKDYYDYMMMTIIA